MTTIFVRPAEGRALIDPATGLSVPDTGTEVERSPFWLRRIADGDAVLADPPKPSSESAPATSEET